jgi:hypothetical protein
VSLPNAPGGVDDPHRTVGGASITTMRTVAHPFRASPWDSSRTKRRREAKLAREAAKKEKHDAAR